MKPKMWKQFLKVKKSNKIIGISAFFCFVIAVQLLSAQTISPFNKLGTTDTSNSYSFLVSGHFHGASSNRSTFPAATLLAGIDTINSLKPFFLISLGDLFLDVNETYINNYQKSLFSKLKMPLFNAVGNHDVSNGNFYEKIYGKTYYSFTDHSELFIVLNTELNDGSIKNEQLTFLEGVLNEATSGKTKNIFIFSHRPIWSENNPRYSKLFAGNTRTALGENNYDDEVKPLLLKISKSKSIYWMSGSMADAPASFFYHKEVESNLTYIQTAIRDLPRDALLQVNLSDGKVSFNGISLTGQTLSPVETYNLDFWNKSIVAEEPFNYRLLPYLTKKMLSGYDFWIGFTSSLLLLLILRYIVNKWKRRG